MRPAIEEVASHRGKWKVEIVGYKHSMSNELVRFFSSCLTFLLSIACLMNW